MNLQQFRYALEIYRSKSFNKAAGVLFVSQPALSQSIRELENDLGFDIFERSNRGVVPTSEGYTFLNSIVDFVHMIEMLQCDECGARSKPKVFRISSSRYTFISSVIMQLYSTHFESGDAYTISMREIDCARVVEDVASGRSDVGVMHIMKPNLQHGLNDLDKKGISYDLIAKSHSHVTFRKGHPLEKKKQINIKDIISFPQVRISTDNADPYDKYTGFNYLKYGNSHKNIISDNRSQIYAFVSNSDAVAYGVTHLEINRYYPNLITKRVMDDDMRYYIYEIHQKNAHIAPHIAEFIRLLKEYGRMENEDEGF